LVLVLVLANLTMSGLEQVVVPLVVAVPMGLIQMMI
jgi:hypothetical protein